MKTSDIVEVTHGTLAEANAWRLRQKRLAKARKEREAQEAAQKKNAPSKMPKAAAPQGSPIKPKNLLNLLKQTFTEWNEDKAPQLSAALAYYTIFSIAPLLVIAIAVAGLVLGPQAVQDKLIGQIQGVVGHDSAVFIQNMVQSASKPSHGILATIIGLVTLLGGAAGVFGQMKAALNTIWNVTPPKVAGIQGILLSLKNQFLSFGMVLGIGFLLMVSLLLSAALSALSQFLSGPNTTLAGVWEIVDIIVSFGVITVLFAAIYRVLPDAKIAWRDVWLGAAITALLFTVGKYLLGLYLGRSTASSTFGAAGSLVVLLLWIYYSSQILFFGAEFTQVYANTHGSRIGTKAAEDAAAINSAKDTTSKALAKGQPARA